MASIEYNGRTFTRLCVIYRVAKTDTNLSFALKFLTSASVALGESLWVTDNWTCKFGQDTGKTVDKKMAKGQSTSKSNFLDTGFSEQSFYFPDKPGSCLRIFTPGGENSTISGSLFECWIISHDCPNHFVPTSEVYNHVPVGKSITVIPL
jgi:hypothetical protein